MTLEIDSIYSGVNPLENWVNLRTEDIYSADPKIWLSQKPDLKLSSEAQGWRETAIKTSIVLLKIILFPWGIYEGCKFLANRFVLGKIYPAQSLPKNKLFEWRKKIIEERNLNGGVMRHVRLEKEGKSYSAFLIGRESTIQNGEWVLHSNGNQASIEKECAILPNYLDAYLKEGLNVLLVNGPGVGCSDSMQTLEDLGDSQELGLIFLESAIKAREITLTGVSLGAGAQSMAINKHEFLPTIRYTVIRLGTFGRLSTLVNSLAGKFGVYLLSWMGYEMDSINASKKLHECGIHEIVFENDEDPLMGKVSLAKGISRECISLQNKTIKTLSFDGHYYCAYEEVIKAIKMQRQLEEQLHVS